MGFVAATKSCILNSYKYSGRASRSEFWWWFLIFIVLVVVLGLIITFSPRDWDDASAFWTAAFILFHPMAFLLILWIPIALAVGSRRLHDMDRSARWCLLPLGLIGFGIVFFFFALNLAFGGPSLETAANVMGICGLASFAAAIGSTAFLSAAGSPGTNRFGDAPSV